MKFSTATKPDSDQILDWIHEVESEVDSKLLGWKDGGVEGDGYDATNAYIDVPPSFTRVTPVQRFELISMGVDPYFTATGVFIPVKKLYPVIPGAITLYRRKSSELEASPTWEALVQGFFEGWVESPDTDFLLVTTKGRAGQLHGIGFFIYSSKIPYAGRATIKATYKYGWNIPGKILAKYCTLKVGIQAAEAVVESGEPVRISSFTGGDFQEFVNTQLTVQIEQWEKKVKEIEKNYFPRKVGAAVLYI